MIVCPRCSKDNQDHYKFCLGCGAELPRDKAQPKNFAAPTPPAGVPTNAGDGPQAGAAQGGAAQGGAMQGGAAQGGAAQGGAGFSAQGQPGASPAPQRQFANAATVVAEPTGAQSPAAEPAQPAMVKCPNCNANVPHDFKFCGSCGHNMSSPAAQAPAAAAAPVVGGKSDGQLVLIRPDGTEGETFPISGSTVVGRDTDGPFASDSYLSPRHAEFTFGNGELVVKDLDSLNGIYYRIPREQPVELTDGAVFRIGQEILRYEAMPEPRTGEDGKQIMGSSNPGYVGRVRLVIGRDAHGSSFCIAPDGIHLGRERGDVVFPEDGYVSGLHCRIHPENDRVWLTDVGSSNGTFQRVSAQHSVARGELLLMGQQLFRADY